MVNDDHDPVGFEKIFNHYVKKADDTTAEFIENSRGYVENNNDLLEKLYVENNNEAIPSPIIGKLSIDKDTIGKIFEILGNQNKEIIELKAKYAELYERDKLNDKISELSTKVSAMEEMKKKMMILKMILKRNLVRKWLRNG